MPTGQEFPVTITPGRGAEDAGSIPRLPRVGSGSRESFSVGDVNGTVAGFIGNRDVRGFLLRRGISENFAVTLTLKPDGPERDIHDSFFLQLSKHCAVISLPIKVNGYFTVRDPLDEEEHSTLVLCLHLSKCVIVVLL